MAEEFFNRGIFLIFLIFCIFFYVPFSTLLHLLTLRFHCVGGCWDQTQACCDFGIGSQRLSPLGKRIGFSTEGYNFVEILKEVSHEIFYFYTIQFLPAPWISHWDLFESLRKLTEIFAICVYCRCQRHRQ